MESIEDMETENNERIPKLLNQLSDRERQLVKYFATGYSNVEVALLVNITPATVKVHKGRVYKKLGVTALKDLMCLLEVKPTYSFD